MDSRPDPSLERIRAILRERGYLDRRLDRLFLGHAGSRFAPLRGALKAGLLSGAFLSVCLLAALRATGNPPLEGPREFLLLGLYLLVLACIVLTAFELVSGAVVLLAARMLPGAARRAGRIAWGMGGVGAALFAAYLSLWWRGRGMTGWSFSAHLAAAAVILALSLAFGRVTSLATLASWIGPNRFPAPRARRPLRFAGPMVLALVAIGLVSPWPGRPAAGRTSAPARVAIEPRDGRILWIGIDGLGEDLYRSLRREGRFPALAALERGGVAGPSSAPRRPPRRSG